MFSVKSAIVSILLCVAAAAQDASRVIAMENAWNRAELHNDAAAIRLLLAADFVMTTAEGTQLNKAEIVASVLNTSYHPDSLQSSEMAVHQHGNTAIVTGTYYEKGSDKGKPYQQRGRFTDTWMFLDGRWQCLASHFSARR